MTQPPPLPSNHVRTAVGPEPVSTAHQPKRPEFPALSTFVAMGTALAFAAPVLAALVGGALGYMQVPESPGRGDIAEMVGGRAILGFVLGVPVGWFLKLIAESVQVFLVIEKNTRTERLP